MANLLLGVALAVAASVVGAVGKQLLRYSGLQSQRGGHVMAKVAVTVGLSMETFLGPILDALSYGFAPQSLIAPLGALGVVWNAVLAPCTLGEKLTVPVVLGCLTIGTGAVMTQLVGADEQEPFTLESTKAFLFRPAVGLYLLVFAAWFLFNLKVLMPRSKNPPGEAWASGDHLRGLSLGMVAGSLSGNMFCVKAFMGLLSDTPEEDLADLWAHWLPYVLLLGAAFFAVSQLYYLTIAMREYEALFMGAVYEGSLITSGSLSGCIIFSELKGQPLLNVFIFFLSVAAIVAGVVVVSCGFTPRANPLPEPIEVQLAEVILPSVAAATQS